MKERQKYIFINHAICHVFSAICILFLSLFISKVEKAYSLVKPVIYVYAYISVLISKFLY